MISNASERSHSMVSHVDSSPVGVWVVVHVCKEVNSLLPHVIMKSQKWWGQMYEGCVCIENKPGHSPHISFNLPCIQCQVKDVT